MVWEEGEALHQLPCSQFSLVVEWEGRSGSSVCVDHCTRQNIHVVSFTEPTSSAGQFPQAPVTYTLKPAHSVFLLNTFLLQVIKSLPQGMKVETSGKVKVEPVPPAKITVQEG